MHEVVSLGAKCFFSVSLASADSSHLVSLILLTRQIGLFVQLKVSQNQKVIRWSLVGEDEIHFVNITASSPAWQVRVSISFYLFLISHSHSHFRYKRRQASLDT